MQKILEEKLKLLFPTDGSTECTLTWKQKATPAGRQYCQLAPSMRPIREIGSGLWPTAVSQDDNKSPKAHMAMKKRMKGGERKTITSLQVMAKANAEMATWATPNTMDGMDARSLEAMKKQFTIARPGRTAPANLREQVHPELYPEALWRSATVRDYKDSGDLSGSMTRKDGKSRLDTIPRLAFGATTDGYSAETVKSGASPQLNPEFVSWLMGYSTAHHSSMLSAMQSYRKSRRDSSKR